MGLWQTVKDLIFPPRCLGCGERIAPSLGKEIAPFLCKDCQKDWEWSTLAQCPQCFAAYCDCTCAPYVLKRAGCEALVKAAPYASEPELCMAQRIVLRNKRDFNRRGIDFCAEALQEGVRKAIAAADEKMSISHTVMAHLPRSRRNYRKYGFDQAQELARSLSRLLDLKYVRLLKRVRDGKEQKSLTLQQRRSNVKGAFSLCQDVEGKRVILVDDIVTTGAGMAEAVRVLRGGGAAQVICVALAITPKEIEDKGSVAKFS